MIGYIDTSAIVTLAFDEAHAPAVAQARVAARLGFRIPLQAT